MIYCVVPRELAGELADQLSRRYADEGNVTVIVDRRRSDRRSRARSAEDVGRQRRLRRDRRRSRVCGELPELIAIA